MTLTVIRGGRWGQPGQVKPGMPPYKLKTDERGLTWVEFAWPPNRPRGSKGNVFDHVPMPLSEAVARGYVPAPVQRDFSVVRNRRRNRR